MEVSKETLEALGATKLTHVGSGWNLYLNKYVVGGLAVIVDGEAWIRVTVERGRVILSSPTLPAPKPEPFPYYDLEDARRVLQEERRIDETEQRNGGGG